MTNINYLSLDILQRLQRWRTSKDVNDSSISGSRPWWEASAKYRGTRGPTFPRGTPKWWRKLHITRPRRRDSRALCHRITKGEDSERLTFPVGSRKPHLYYCGGGRTSWRPMIAAQTGYRPLRHIRTARHNDYKPADQHLVTRGNAFRILRFSIISNRMRSMLD